MKKVAPGKKVAGDQKEDPIEEDVGDPDAHPDALKAEANMDAAVGAFGAFGLMKGSIMQTVPEEITSPRSGTQKTDDDEEKEDEEDEDLSRAGVSTRGMNRGVKKDETFNEDLEINTVPQVSILDNDGKEMLGDDETDEE